MIDMILKAHVFGNLVENPPKSTFGNGDYSRLERRQCGQGLTVQSEPFLSADSELTV